MDLDWIETFLDVMETRSFNRTADRLAITQSTVSHRIRSLETALGRRLLERSRAGVEPTRAGARFHDHAILLRRQWREAARQVGATDGADRTLRIGVQYDLAETIAGPVFQDLRVQLPQTVLALEVDYSVQMLSDMLAGELDVGAVFSPRYFPDLYIEHVGELPYFMVCAPDGDAASLDVDRYCVPNISPAFRRVHDMRHPEYADAKVACGQSRAIVDVIRLTGGASYVFAPIARALAEEGAVAIMDDCEPIHQPVYLAVAARDRRLATHVKTMNVLRSFIIEHTKNTGAYS